MPTYLPTYLRLRCVRRREECLRMRAHFIKSEVEKRERVAVAPCIFFDTPMLPPHPRLSFESVLG